MKRVSFKVAKALKEAGYPQRKTDIAYLLQTISDFNKEYKYRELVQKQIAFPQDVTADAPTYLEVWLWLWREKNIHLNTDTSRKDVVCIYWDSTIIHEIKT